MATPDEREQQRRGRDSSACARLSLWGAAVSAREIRVPVHHEPTRRFVLCSCCCCHTMWHVLCSCCCHTMWHVLSSCGCHATCEHSAAHRSAIVVALAARRGAGVLRPALQERGEGIDVAEASRIYGQADAVLRMNVENEGGIVPTTLSQGAARATREVEVSSQQSARKRARDDGGARARASSPTLLSHRPEPSSPSPTTSTAPRSSTSISKNNIPITCDSDNSSTITCAWRRSQDAS